MSLIKEGPFAHFDCGDDCNINNPPQSPDDPHCVHCRCLMSMHITVNGGWVEAPVWKVVCLNDTNRIFTPYEDGDYARDEDDAREDAALARAGQ